MPRARIHKRTLIKWIARRLTYEPEDREQLLVVLRKAYEKHLIDSDSLTMIEGVLQVGELQVRDIMIPRVKMDVLDINTDISDSVRTVISTAHSRFPVIDGNKNKVIGILLAKDILRYYTGDAIEVRDMLRPAVFIPESKRLNVLLKDFKNTRNHIAIVVDEYGGVVGLVTIEDVLEQIVGDIEDEYDIDDDKDDIVQQNAQQYRMKATAEIAAVNAQLTTTLNDKEFSTIGGLVMQAFGYLPKRNETTTINNLRITILSADSQRIHSLLVEVMPPPIGTP